MSVQEPTVVYEDRWLVAVSKPAGVVVIQGRGAAGEPLNRSLERRLEARLYVVHRIDREASGLVLFAKDAATHRALCAQFEGRKVFKRYLALVRGRPDREGCVDKPIKAFGSGRMGVGEGGKPSLTRYRALKTFPNSTLLEVVPTTGRRHQIRVHLYSIGHPIWGDPLYGPRQVAGRLMLHAWELSFIAPDGKPLTLTAQAPEDFNRILGRYEAPDSGNVRPTLP